MMNMKKRLTDGPLQYLLLAVCSLAVLALVVLTALELLPASAGGVKIQKAFEVSSAPVYADETLYSAEVRGTLKNNTKKHVRVEQIAVVVGDGETKKTVEMGEVILPPQGEVETVYSFEDATDFEIVYRLSVMIEGKTFSIANRNAGDLPISGVIVLYLILLACAVFLLIRLAKSCYYLHQEKKKTL